ncbi:MAG: hypothetical protein ACI867_000922 [Glaciecola sp.]|jgi:hypothetical protein
MATQCDGCDEPITGSRVVFTSEATDRTGVDVIVTKRWGVCPPCAQRVFTAIDEPSPWSDEDFKTMVMPDEASMSGPLGGVPPRTNLSG